MAPRLFITDFDGTLLTGERTIRSEDIDTLKRLRRRGIKTAVATGRSLYSFQNALNALEKTVGPDGFPVDYVIFSTGAGILNAETGAVFFQKDIPAVEIKTITDYLDRKRLDYMVHEAIPDTRCFMYRSFGNDNPDFNRRIEMYNSWARPMSEDFLHQKAATEVLAIIPPLPENMRSDLLVRSQQSLSQFSIIHATSPLDHESIWMEIFHKDVSKSRTTAFLARKLGLERKEVVSIGNDYNDQDLLEWSGRGFVVDNAPDALKQKFETVPSNNDNGVTRAAVLSGCL